MRHTIARLKTPHTHTHKRIVLGQINTHFVYRYMVSEMSEFLSIERHARAIKHANNTHIHNSLVILYIYMSCVCRGCLNHAEFRPLAPPRSWRRDLSPQHHCSHPDGRAQCFIMRNVSPRDANKDVSSHAECAPRTHIHCAKSQAP